MYVKVNGVRLFVEVLSPKLRPEGPRMREVPTVVALHGGPLDHAHMRDWVAPLADVAQLVLYDHRGCGRSEAGDPALWTMAQWGDDVAGVCDVLGIEKPIVVGCSFGSFVAQSSMSPAARRFASASVELWGHVTNSSGSTSIRHVSPDFEAATVPPRSWERGISIMSPKIHRRACAETYGCDVANERRGFCTARCAASLQS